MPLNVVLAINDQPIQWIKISRLEKLKAKNRNYQYLVQTEGASTTFVHCYADGAEECVRRALEALALHRERIAEGT